MGRRHRAALAVAIVCVGATLVSGLPATASGGAVGGSGTQWFLTDGWSGTTDHAFTWGRADDAVHVGDWDGDGGDTLATRRDATFAYDDVLGGGGDVRTGRYGTPSDVALTGDWDGDGVDTPAVRRGATYYLTNRPEGGAAQRVVSYGRADDLVVVGDWDGDGRDSLGIRRGTTFHLANSLTGGGADVSFSFGRATDQAYVGDWDGDGVDTPAVRHGSTYFVSDSLRGGAADRTQVYGRAGDTALVGDWDGDGRDTLGLRRGAALPAGVVWAQEFDGPAGSAPDPATWNLETGAGGWGNAELQNYTASRANSSLDGAGALVITAKKEADGSYTSARMTTQGRFQTQYGRVEARIAIPRGQGIWPAFWMLGADLPSKGWPAAGEIDVMENIGREPSLVHGTVHGPGYSGGDGISGTYAHPRGWSFADDFHTYAVDRKPGSIEWSVDGQVYHRVTRADTGGDPWVFDAPFFLILNVAVGGQWPGYPDASTRLPQQMTVDYVRVYSN